MVEHLLPKQRVASSSLVSRSTGVTGGLAFRNSLSVHILRYDLCAQAKGLSPSIIIHVKRCVGFFAEFLDGINDVSELEADDLRRFVKLRTSERALPEMRAVAGEIRRMLKELAPKVFNGL